MTPPAERARPGPLGGHTLEDGSKIERVGSGLRGADAVAFVAEVQKRSAPIINEWIKKANAKGVNAAKIRAELKKVRGS